MKAAVTTAGSQRGPTNLFAVRPRVVALQTGPHETTVLGLVTKGWAYEMRLVLQNGCWVVAALRVFPDFGEVKAHWLYGKVRSTIDLGFEDQAARYARALARTALQARERAGLGAVPLGGLTARHLREISFGRDSYAKWLNQPMPEIDRALEKSLATADGDRRLAQVAAEYVHALSRGSRRVNEDVAAALHMQATEVRDAVHKARLQRLLTGTRKQGTPGGELTARARELLRPRSAESKPVEWSSLRKALANRAATRDE